MMIQMLIENYGHLFFEWCMVAALAIAIIEIRGNQKKIKDIHKKICCDDDSHA